MNPEEITHELRVLHEQVLVCGVCRAALVPSDRGWRCEQVAHVGGDVDNDRQAQMLLMMKTGCRPMAAAAAVRQYRMFAGPRTVADRDSVFARKQ